MSYVKQNWQDRVVEKPLTFWVTNNPDGTITLTPEPGVVVHEGTPVTAGNMNNLEQGIADAHDVVAEARADILGVDNQSVARRKATVIRIDTRVLELNYDATSGKLETIVEKDGIADVKVITLGYDVHGALQTVTEVAGGNTVVSTLNYTNGRLSGVSRSVS